MQFENDNQQGGGTTAGEMMGFSVRQMGSPMGAVAGSPNAAQPKDMTGTFPQNRVSLNEGRVSVAEGSYAQAANYVHATTYAKHRQVSEGGLGLLEGVLMGHSRRQQKPETASEGRSAGQSFGQQGMLPTGPLSQETARPDDKQQEVQFAVSDEMPRFRAANPTNISGPPHMKTSMKPKTAAERPVSKPLTVSRRYHPV